MAENTLSGINAVVRYILIPQRESVVTGNVLTKVNHVSIIIGKYPQKFKPAGTFVDISAHNTLAL